MILTVKITGLDDLLARLIRGRRAAGAGSPKTDKAMRTIGALELEQQRANFMIRSRGGQADGFGWIRLSPMTALLRRSGRTRKLPDWASLVEIARTLPMLTDTGRLLASLAPGAAGNILEPGPLSVAVGTNVEYAELMHLGGQSEPAIASRSEADAAVGRTFLKVLPGRKSKETSGGRKSWAKKNWNPEFFRIRGWLRNRVGVSFAVPARPILSVPPQDRLDGYAERLKGAIVKDLGGTGGAA